VLEENSASGTSTSSASGAGGSDTGSTLGLGEAGGVDDSGEFGSEGWSKEVRSREFVCGVDVNAPMGIRQRNVFTGYGCIGRE
jgi:hypothetical protein